MIANALAFITQWWKFILAALAAVLLSYNLGSCQGRKDGRLQMEAAIERANTKALQEKARADDLAARQRITDTIAVNRQEQEMIDAVRQGPDSAPDSASLRLGCDRLRRQNPGAALPAACR